MIDIKWKLLVCKSCRAYGIPLLDGFCEACYTVKYKARKALQPGELPYALLGGGRTTKKEKD